MGGVTRVGRGVIPQILLWGEKGDLTGQEWCTAVPKSLLNPPRTGSKTERHGVRKEGEDKTSPFFVQYVTYPPSPLSVKGACRFAPLNFFTERVQQNLKFGHFWSPL